MPGIVEHRFNQLQEVEAILEFLNIQLRKKRSEMFRKYTESYNRALSDRSAEIYRKDDYRRTQPKVRFTSETTAWQYNLMLSLLGSSTSLRISSACTPSSIAEASALDKE